MSENILFGTRSQSTYPGVSEGNAVATRHNPRGELVVPDWYTQLVLDGRVFNVSNAVQETAANLNETARGTDNVNPVLLLSVPLGTTAIPLEIVIITSGTGTAEDLTVTINTDDAARFSSGGAIITPLNMRKDDLVTSACTFYAGSTQIVATANTDDDTIYASRVDSTQIATPTMPFLDWSARRFVPPVLFGAASLLVFIVSATDDHTFFFSVKWAEIPSVSV